jgi:hypothetical protein
MISTAWWWSPTRSARGLAGEVVHHGRAWAHLRGHGGKRMSNFGDEVSPWLLEELTGTRPGWAPVDRAELICVGSILDAYARGGGRGQVLGSGIREPSTVATEAIDLDRVLLVRGEGTRRLLGADASLPLGDPGLVIANIVAPASHGRRGVVVVPHFAGLGDRSVRTLLAACRAEGWQVLLPNLPPLQVARSISSAELVLTSSLHGLVFADAYGVPGQLVSMDAGTAREPSFKYQDYGSALGVTDVPVPLAALVAAPDPGAIVDRLADRTAAVAAALPGVLEGIYSSARPLR